LHLTEYARGGGDQCSDPDQRGEDARGLPGCAGHRGLQHVRGLLSHETAELADNCAASSILAEGEAGDRNDNE